MFQDEEAPSSLTDISMAWVCHNVEVLCVAQEDGSLHFCHCPVFPQELADQLLHKMTDEGTIAHYNPCRCMQICELMFWLVLQRLITSTLSKKGTKAVTFSKATCLYLKGPFWYLKRYILVLKLYIFEPNRYKSVPFEKVLPSDSFYIYIYAFIRLFYPKRLQCIQAIYISLYVCSLGIEPTPFALLTQCSTTEPQEHRFCTFYFWECKIKVLCT